jgi:hypothetical protein
MAAAAVIAAAGIAVHPSATALAQDPPAPMHAVKYTVWAEQPTFVDIYYRDIEPANWADYSHNPYLYSPKVQSDIGPNQQWNLDVSLANPEEWAMVVASSGTEPGPPNVHCVLAVDGVVVKTQQGPKGALCSIRNW